MRPDIGPPGVNPHTTWNKTISATISAMNCNVPLGEWQEHRGTDTHTHSVTRTQAHTDVYCCWRIRIAVTTTLLRINCLSLLHYLIGRLTFSLQYITYSCTPFTPAHGSTQRASFGTATLCPGSRGDAGWREAARDNARNLGGRLTQNMHMWGGGGGEWREDRHRMLQWKESVTVPGAQRWTAAASCGIHH